MSELSKEQINFINIAIESKALQFGEFTLKSGRTSPYFFNASKLLNSERLSEVIEAFTSRVNNDILNIDQVFGPAYKGTIFGSMVGLELKKINSKLSLCFDRKEEKDHGEGGLFIGEKPKGRVLIIDDVLSAGTAAKSSINLIKKEQANPKILLIGLDRQEKGAGVMLARDELEQLYDLKVMSVISLDNLIEFSSKDSEFKIWENKLSNYREKWGS